MTTKKVTRFACPVCGKLTSGRLPVNPRNHLEKGDGSFRYPRKHKNRGVFCKGSLMEAVWMDFDEDLPQPRSEPFKIVKPSEVAKKYFAEGLFRIKGGRTLYDEVWIADGGRAFYLLRLVQDQSVEMGRRPRSIGLYQKRWISEETDLEMMYDPTR